MGRRRVRAAGPAEGPRRAGRLLRRRPGDHGRGRSARGGRVPRRPLGAAQAQPRRVRPGHRHQHRPEARRGHRAGRAATRRVLGARRRGAGAPARHAVRGLGVRSGRTPGRGRRAVRRPEPRARDPRAAALAVHRSRRAVAPRAGRRGRRRDLDAEDEDAPLGGRHALDEELLRLRPRPHLRLAEERAALGGPAGGDRRRGLGRAPRAADRRRDRRDGGQRADRRDPGAGRRAGVRDRSGGDRLDRGARDGPGSRGDLARERGRAVPRPVRPRADRAGRRGPRALDDVVRRAAGVRGPQDRLRAAPTPASATRTPDATGDHRGRWSAWHRPEPSPPCSRSAC